jgi:hypothetical protein
MSRRTVLLAAALLLAPLAAGSACRGRSGDGPTPKTEEAFVIPHALAPAGKVYVSESSGWADQAATLPFLPADRLVRVPAFGEDGRPSAGLLSAWVTDEWLLGWRGGQRAVLKTPGDNGLADWGSEHFKDYAGRGLYLEPVARPAPGAHSRFDEGGAVMASPPRPGFPLGRLIVARDVSGAFKDFLRRQRVQAGRFGRLIEIDTSWLKVGHVDEMINFVPSASAPGFRLVYPDPLAGLELLRTAPPGSACFAGDGVAEFVGVATGGAIRVLESAADLPAPPAGGKWAFVRIWQGKGAGLVGRVHRVQGRKIIIEHVWDTRDHSGNGSPGLGMCMAMEGRCDSMPIWFDPPDATSRFLLVSGSRMWVDAGGEDFPAVMLCGELAGDRLLAQTNVRTAGRCRAAARQVCRALGLANTDAVALPALFAAPGLDATGAFALMPSAVNLQNVDGRVILLRGYGPRLDGADGQPAADGDTFTAAIRRALAGATQAPLHFLDGWDSLHRHNGGARCGTNVWREGPAGGKPPRE